MVDAAFAALLITAQVVYLAVMGTLGVRLLLLAQRSRQLPEALLATHFLVCCSIGYVLLITGLSGARDPGLLPAALVPWLIGIGYLASALGVFAEIAFNRLVFRRDAGFAKALVALAAVALFVGWVGIGASGGFVHGRFEGLWVWLVYGTFIAGAAWVMVEPILYHRSMRKRLRLGLAEPLVVNRFLLWGIGSVFRFAMVAGGVIPAALLDERKTQLVPDGVGLALLAVALIGVGVAVCYWLTFFPTRGYERFIASRAARAAVPARLDLGN